MQLVKGLMIKKQPWTQKGVKKRAAPI